MFFPKSPVVSFVRGQDFVQFVQRNDSRFARGIFVLNASEVRSQRLRCSPDALAVVYRKNIRLKCLLWVTQIGFRCWTELTAPVIAGIDVL